MLKARDGAYGIGRRKGDDRTDVWWKWKLDPMSVDAVVIYAERGPRPPLGRLHRLHLRRLERGRRGRDPRAGAVRQGLFGAVGQGNSRDGRNRPPHHGRDLRAGAKPDPTQVFELGFEGIAPSKRHRSGVAVRFPRMLRWRRDKPIAEADTLDALKALLAGQGGLK